MAMYATSEKVGATRRRRGLYIFRMTTPSWLRCLVPHIPAGAWGRIKRKIHRPFFKGKVVDAGGLRIYMYMYYGCSS
jgi:hypothetical protein